MSLRGRVRQAAQKQGGTFSYSDLGDALGLQTRDELYKMKMAVSDLVRNGEMVRVRPGQFNWQGKKPGPTNQKQVMWRVLRARKLVTVLDLMELAGASQDYALEFLRRLQKQEAVQRVEHPGYSTKYRLVNDPGPELPRDVDKAEYLKRRHEQQKAALASLDAVYNGALDVMQKAAEARLAVSRLEES